tara:strand:+ start:1767 stop:1967 length:201 start_codon:yes stop_codon:yes gene_type:complete
MSTGEGKKGKRSPRGWGGEGWDERSRDFLDQAFPINLDIGYAYKQDKSRLVSYKLEYFMDNIEFKP